MKKGLLFGIASLALSANLFAQSPVIIYNGTAGQLFNGTFMAFDSAYAAEDSLDGNAYLKIWGTSPDSTWKVGDVTNAAKDVFDAVLPLGYTGTVANSLLSFKVFTDTTMAGLMIEFMTTSNVLYGYKWDSIPGSDTGFVEVMVPLSEFTTVVDGNLTNVSITDQLLQGSTSQIRFGLYASDSSTFAMIGLDDIQIGNSSVTDLQDATVADANQTIYPNPCQTGLIFLGETPKDYSIMNASGIVVKTGKGKSADVSELNSGIYYIKMDENVQKVILN